jgi:hypothetical protein
LFTGVEKFSRDRCASRLMRVALTVLCIGAVTFLLRVLAALVKEAKGMPPVTVIHSARLEPPRERGELVEMNPEGQRTRGPARTRERIAL